MARVLVTDAEQRSSLAAVRSLGKAGHHVVACSAQDRPLAGASRFCRACRVVPDPGVDPGGFQAAIARIVSEERIEIVLPMTDVSVPSVLALRASHPSVKVPFPEGSAYEAVSDKEGLMRIASQVGVPVPRQAVLHHAGDVDVLGTVGFPLVLKPARSAVRTETGVEKFGVSSVPDEPAVPAILAGYPPAAYPLLAQERIVGPGLGVFMLMWDGQTLATFAHRRIREKPPTGGVSVYRESVEVSAELAEYAERLLRHFCWNGVAMVEFKQDARSGRFYLMEINGRFWGSLQLAIDAGVDFPSMLVSAALGAEVKPISGYALGVRSKWLWGEVDHLLWILRASSETRRNHPDVPGRLRALAQLAIPWRPGDRWEVLRWSDPRPFIRESLNWVRDLAR